MTYLRNTLVLALAALAGACTNTPLREYVPQIVTPYRIDIQQGNFVTMDMVDKLQAGQTKEQVRFIFGTPMLTDVFHQERWDFIFRSAKGWNDPEKRRLTVFFDKTEKVEKWEAVDVPKAVDVAAPAPPEPQGFFSSLFGGSPDAATSAPVVAAVAAPPQPPPAAAATPATVAVPATKPAVAEERGFFSRIFGSSKPADSAVPASAPAVAAVAAAAAAAAKPAVPPAPVANTPAQVETAPAASPPAAKPPQPTVPPPVIVPAPPPAVVAAAPAAPAPPPPPPPAVPPPTAAPIPAPPPVPVPAVSPVTPVAATQAAPASPGVITTAIEQWRTAWAAKDSAAYLSFYAPDFKPQGMTRVKWEAQRKERLAKPSFIVVQFADIQISLTDKSATAIFVQIYESDTFKEDGKKTLVFGNYAGKWLIREESFLANSK